MTVKKLGKHTTGIEALQGADLSGKLAIVTGGNSGIGKETVRSLAYAGAHVILACRNLKAGEEAASDIKATGVKGTIVVKQLDLSDTASIRAFVKDVLATEKHIDILELNAGVMACPLSYTKDGFELQIGTNHFGHFLLTQLLLPKLIEQNTPVRIVSVASIGYLLGYIDLDDLHFKKRSYDNWKSYSQSKLANILFARELARRTQGTKIRAFSLHPGNVKTDLQRHTFFSTGTCMSIVAGLLFYDRNVEQGAASQVWAATAPELENQSGAYIVNCHVKKPVTKAAVDDDLAKKLWDETEKQLLALENK